MLLILTELAKLHFTNLIKLQEKRLKEKQLNLRIQAIAPGTNKANIELSYCPNVEQKSSDVAVDCDNFILYVEKSSGHALTDAIIDYREDEQVVGKGKLHIKAPCLKGKCCSSTTASLSDDNIGLFARIKNFLDERINPNLAMHGGVVNLIEVNDVKGEVVLQFGGGCKGCSMVDFTLKQGIENSLKSQFSEIVLIKDVTDHAVGENPFYK